MPLQIRRYILSDWTVAVSVRYSCATNRKTQDISFVQVCVLHKCATFEIWSLTKATQLQHQSQTRLILFESFTSHVVEQDFSANFEYKNCQQSSLQNYDLFQNTFSCKWKGNVSCVDALFRQHCHCKLFFCIFSTCKAYQVHSNYLFHFALTRDE